MPLSMAACRTVLPFSMVTCRPSIVSVTVSIAVDHIRTPTGISGRPPRVAGCRELRDSGLRIDCGFGLSAIRSPQSAIPRSAMRCSVLDNLHQRPVVLAHVDAPERAGERDALLDDSVGRGDQQVEGFPVGILERDGEGHVEPLADLLDVKHGVGSLDAIAHLDLRQGRAVNPPREEAFEWPAGLLFHRGTELFGAHFAKPRRAIEAPQSAEEAVVANEPPQHVQHRGALVVDQRAEHAALPANVPEPVTEIHRPLLRLVDAPLAELSQDGDEDVVAALVLCVHRREVLREALADPLLMVVPPADRLTPPLVRELVREEELRIAPERGRIVAPDELRARELLIERGEIAGAVAARQIALDEGDREARIWRIADERLVEHRHVGGALGELAAALHLPRVGFHR